MKSFINELQEKLKRLIYKLLSLTFLTWLAVTYIYWYNKQPIDMNYLAFTAVIVLGKNWMDFKKNKV